MKYAEHLTVKGTPSAKIIFITSCCGDYEGWK